MAALYDVELNAILDEMVPASCYSRKPRPSDPWFNKECRDVKRLTRRLESVSAGATRRATSATAVDGAADKAAAA